MPGSGLCAGLNIPRPQAPTVCEQSKEGQLCMDMGTGHPESGYSWSLPQTGTGGRANFL